MVQSIVVDTELYDTYNFEVADYHTYFVGEQGAWVHNQCNATMETERVFHRLGDSKESIEAIAKSGELKGNPPRNFFASDIPKVQAYEGPLPPNAKGFEFTTPAKPDRGHVPGKPTWSGSGHNPDVRTVNDQAIISCTVTRVNC